MVFLSTILLVVLAYTAKSASGVQCPGVHHSVQCPGVSDHLPAGFKDEIACCARGGIWEVKQPLMEEWIDMMSQRSFDPNRQKDLWDYKKDIGKGSDFKDKIGLSKHHLISYEIIQDRQKEMATAITNMRRSSDRNQAHQKNMNIINRLLRTRPEWNEVFGENVNERDRESLEALKSNVAFILFQMFQWTPDNLFLGPGSDKGSVRPNDPKSKPDDEIWTNLGRDAKNKFPLIKGRSKHFQVEASSYRLRNWNPIIQVLAGLKWKALGPIWEERGDNKWYVAKSTSQGLCSYDIPSLLLNKCIGYQRSEYQLYVDITNGEKGCGYYHTQSGWIIDDNGRKNGHSIDRTHGSCS